MHHLVIRQLILTLKLLLKVNLIHTLSKSLDTEPINCGCSNIGIEIHNCSNVEFYICFIY